MQNYSDLDWSKTSNGGLYIDRKHSNNQIYFKEEGGSNGSSQYLTLNSGTPLNISDTDITLDYNNFTNSTDTSTIYNKAASFVE